jgi:hypothetical protein
LSNLTSDQATATAHAEGPITIGSRAYSREDALGVLGSRLDSLPLNIREKRLVPLGEFRGLNFGLVLNPQYAPELYLEGATTLQSMLSREHHGPRAILNALERLASSYGTECTRVRQNLAIAESQLRDYQVRLDKPFNHEDYLSALTTLRDQLKAGLSGKTSDPDTETLPTVSELAQKIKALKAAHTVEATPERLGKHHYSAEEPVAARLHRLMVTPVFIATIGPDAP